MWRKCKPLFHLPLKTFSGFLLSVSTFSSPASLRLYVRSLYGLLQLCERLALSGLGNGRAAFLIPTDFMCQQTY